MHEDVRINISSRGAGSEVWNRVYMIAPVVAPVKKSGRVRLSTVFFQNKYGGEYRHGRTTRFCSVWVFPRPNIKKRFSDFRATSLVFISYIFPPTVVLRTLFLILNTCYELTILVHGLATVIWEWSLNQFSTSRFVSLFVNREPQQIFIYFPVTLLHIYWVCQYKLFLISESWEGLLNLQNLHWNITGVIINKFPTAILYLVVLY